MPSGRRLTEYEKRSIQLAKTEIKQYLLLRPEGCPICSVCNELLEKGWFWFSSWSYSEGDGVSRYIGNWGFCEKHSTMVAEKIPAWQKSVVYQWTFKARVPDLQRAMKTMEKYARRSGITGRLGYTKIRKVLAEVKPKGGCIFCESTTETARSYISKLLTALSDPEIQRTYENSYGLCMQHFFQALDEFRGEHTPQLLTIMKVQTERLNDLNADFEEFFRKSDYRFSSEPKGREQTAWIRAMKRVIGDVELGAERETRPH